MAKIEFDFKTSDFKTGDLIFKTSRFSDGKLLMRFVNFVTRLWSRSSYDHVEVVVKPCEIYAQYDENFVLVSSSEGSVGVRTSTLNNWMRKCGNPYITVIRPKYPLTGLECAVLEQRIKQDLGKQYDTIGVVEARLMMDRHEMSIEEANEKLFCSEAVSKWTGDERWQNTWPDELYDRKIEKGYTVVYKGESKNLK